MESNQEILEIAMANLLEEFKEVRQHQAETNKAIVELKDKVEGFDEKLNNVKIIPPSINTLPITDAVSKGMERVKRTIEEQPKSITREFRILLFPQYGATEYYKLVFGRILFWMLVFLTVTYLFAFAKQYLDTNATVKQTELENDNIRKAWKYLYKHNSKVIKDKMDSAYQKIQ